jgi:predicted acylesterase/phospholipase RssA
MDLAMSERWYPRVLVCGSGGVKGLSLLGFLSTIEDIGLLESIDTYCGVSVGAVISLLLTVGYKVREIITIAVFLDVLNVFTSFHFQSTIENKGLISNKPVREILNKLVIDKMGEIPTLSHLYTRTGISLVTVTLNVTTDQCEYMTASTHPHVSCVDAVLCSMNLPFIFYQMIYENNNYVDGGLANPYPIDYFDDGQTNILGVYMESVFEERTGNLPLSLYYSKLMYSIMAHRRNHIIEQSSNHCKHVCLEIHQSKSNDTLGYSFTLDDKVQLIVDGYNRGLEFIKNVDTPQAPKTKQRYVYPTPT